MLKVTKRNGEIVDFDKYKILSALKKCFNNYEQESKKSLERITEITVELLDSKFKPATTVNVEQIQDTVEEALKILGEDKAYQRFASVRAEHAIKRSKREVPDSIKAEFEKSSQYFPTLLQEFQFYDKYSNYNSLLGRRETWKETVTRVMNELQKLSGNNLTDEEGSELENAILNMEVLPSMRLVAMAGKGLSDTHYFNCSYLPIKDIYSYVEIMIISMSGCGVGFSVEKEYVENLPRVKYQKQITSLRDVELVGLRTKDGLNLNTVKFNRLEDRNNKILVHVDDSAEGWAEALHVGMQLWFDGYDCEFDYSAIRPAGAPLKRKGGQASGYLPLKKSLDSVRSIILSRQGSVINTLDAHDMACWVGRCAASGGVRRAAMISLFSWDDANMRNAKDSSAMANNEQRWYANNSIVFPDRTLSQLEVLNLMTEMYNHGTGEPGLFNRPQIYNSLPKHRTTKDKNGLIKFGVNPCGEVILRPYEFCNLSAVVARAEDTFETLKRKVKLATLIGTIQSMADNYDYLRPEWRKNSIEERLLGVDITGQMDSPAARDIQNKVNLKNYVEELNAEYAARFGINKSASTTVVKPSGNSSQLVNCSSGLHPRWAKYYNRHVRVPAQSPSRKVLLEHNIPLYKENGEEDKPDHEVEMWVARFLVKAPENSITRDMMSIEDQVQNWLENKLFWTTHNPSVTINYREDELIRLAELVHENQNMIVGIAMLPYSADDAYRLLPYVEIDKETYDREIVNYPDRIDWSNLFGWEFTDQSDASNEKACLAGGCDL